MSMWNTLTIEYKNKETANKAKKKLEKQEEPYKVRIKNNLVYVNFWNSANLPKSVAMKVDDGIKKFVIALFEDTCDTAKATVYSNNFTEKKVYGFKEKEKLVKEVKNKEGIKISEKFS